MKHLVFDFFPFRSQYSVLGKKVKFRFDRLVKLLFRKKIYHYVFQFYIFILFPAERVFSTNFYKLAKVIRVMIMVTESLA